MRSTCGDDTVCNQVAIDLRGVYGDGLSFCGARERIIRRSYKFMPLTSPRPNERDSGAFVSVRMAFVYGWSQEGSSRHGILRGRCCSYSLKSLAMLLAKSILPSSCAAAIASPSDRAAASY